MKWLKSGLLAIVLVVAASSLAQVITPMELSDPKARLLQQRYLNALVAIGDEIEAHKFPYPFHLNRALDVDLAKVKADDNRSIRFDFYKSQTVLAITGNYYAAYSADQMDSFARLKETFQAVILPILQAAVPHFPDDSSFSAFAIEVSHHVRQKVMNVSSEHPENVMVVIPVLSAQKLVDAKTVDQKQAAILEAEVFLNGQPTLLWLQEGGPSDEWIERNTPLPAAKKQPVQTATDTANSIASSPSVSANLMKATPPTMKIFTPEALSKLQRDNEDAITRLTKKLDQEAHFVTYAPPTFIGFRQGAYLQLSVRSQLNVPAGASRYKLAALAFDDHISHLIRPVLDYFPPEPDFDGISFSSTVFVADGTSPLAVEFFFPFRMMHCFAGFDCTGQQLIDSGTVVINGERSALDLQIAEGKN